MKTILFLGLAASVARAAPGYGSEYKDESDCDDSAPEQVVYEDQAYAAPDPAYEQTKPEKPSGGYTTPEKPSGGYTEPEQPSGYENPEPAPAPAPGTSPGGYGRSEKPGTNKPGYTPEYTPYKPGKPTSPNPDGQCYCPVCPDPYHPGNGGNGGNGGGNGGNGDNGECKEKRNMIVLISDGFGPASETVARQYFAASNSTVLDEYGAFPLDNMQVGAVRTHSASHWITDSASSATAYSCGIKTYNAAIAVDNDAKPCATVLEAAKELGYTTGLVATSRITHATPASFSAHIGQRDDENGIALHQMGEYVFGRQVDLLMGGGRRHFVPESAGGKREDGRNLLEEASEFGWNTVIEDLSGFDSLNAESLPLMAFFADSHMDYEIDRNPEEQPSLRQMAEKTIGILSDATQNDCDSPGFFVMIEGSRIDHAAHDNDIGGHFGDVMAYHDMANYVMSWVGENGNTFALSVADHETGGLTIGNAPPDIVGYPYQWFPNFVTQATHSADWCEKTLNEAVEQGADPETTTRSMIAENLGVTDPSDAEVQRIVDGIELDKNPDLEFPAYVRWGFAQILSDRAEVGWSTHGHSGVDVNLYSWGNTPATFRGNLDNTQVGTAVQGYMNITQEQISALTARLDASMTIEKPEDIEKRSCSHD